MKNFEKYKTTKEREHAYVEYCRKHSNCGSCALCPLNDKNEKAYVCSFFWLDLEAEEEKPMNCPFCGCRCERFGVRDSIQIVCDDPCGYRTKYYDSYEEAVAAHNRVCKAVSAYGKER